MPDIKLVTVASDGAVSLALDLTAEVITGMDALFQRILLKFLKTPGSDILNPQDGGGLQQLLFASSGGSDDPQVIADVTEVVRQVRRQLVQDQQSVQIPASERLADMSITDLVLDVETTSLVLTVSFTSAEGRTALRTIGL